MGIIKGIPINMLQNTTKIIKFWECSHSSPFSHRINELLYITHFHYKYLNFIQSEDDEWKFKYHLVNRQFIVLFLCF